MVRRTGKRRIPPKAGIGLVAIGKRSLKGLFDVANLAVGIEHGIGYCRGASRRNDSADPVGIIVNISWRAIGIPNDHAGILPSQWARSAAKHLAKVGFGIEQGSWRASVR